MARPRGQQVLELEGVLHRVAGRLTPAHVATLVADTDAVRSALAAAADVLITEDAGRPAVETVAGTGPALASPEEASERMAERTREGAAETLLTSDELAARVGFKTRQSAHDWLKKGRIVGWQGARRGYVFPAGQFDERGRPFEGLDRLVGLFDNGYAAWVWLTTPSAYLDGAMPLTLLAAGEIGRVTKTAEGDGQGDFA